MNPSSEEETSSFHYKVGSILRDKEWEYFCTNFKYKNKSLEYIFTQKVFLECFLPTMIYILKNRVILQWKNTALRILMPYLITYSPP